MRDHTGIKLLIVTQTVDTEDSVLGFFVRWIEELAKHLEHIDVICLKKGKHSLPTNVRVHSLGKEKGISRFKYVLNFYRYIWKFRHDYDAVFVHMNPEYVILGGPFWQMWGKRIVFWYNHPQDNLRLRFGVVFADQVLYTSPYAATARFEKARRMPAGIDTELFVSQSIPRVPCGIYMQGRVAPSKRVHLLLQALRLLRKKDILATVTIVGPEDSAYGASLRHDFADLIAMGAIFFRGPKRNTETPLLYGAHRVAVNLSAAGHYDKSILEAMACETPVIVSSKAFVGLVPDEWIVPENDPAALAHAISDMLELPESAYHALGTTERAAVIREHSLLHLSAALVRSFAPAYHNGT